ncbi:MAG TPA: low specificity L-threonine aldolase [Rhizomicrobium sp.]|jgi:threonine aldolase|nr:low specificity L-threonine aldolase [Rhizomicrobium sp.]
MNFSSDNAYGAAPEILRAIQAANDGAVPSYGDDPLTQRLAAEMARVFEHPVSVFPVISGTAANALALASVVPPHGAILCHSAAHIATDECGAPEFFTHGARVVTLGGALGKLRPEDVASRLAHFIHDCVHHSQPAAVSISQCTELGTCYRPEETRLLADFAHRQGMKLHMDGARFANAVAHLGRAPAEATWKAGVDVLSFGATKNGALGAEAVVFFNPDDAADFRFRRKRSGHLLSKMRFVSAQIVCALEQDRWLAWAARANALAGQLYTQLHNLPGVEIAWPVEANAMFAWLPEGMIATLRAHGASFYEWAPPTGARTLVRLVTSFATPQSEIERFVEIARDWAVKCGRAG